MLSAGVSLPSDADIDVARNAAQADPRNVTMLIPLAEDLLHAGAPDRAAALIREALLFAPDSFAVLMSTSAILGIVEALDEALDAAQRAATLRPDSAEAWRQLGALSLRLRRYEAAAAALLALVTLEPADASGWRMFSDALQGSGRGPRAVEAMERALALAQDNVEYRIHYAGLIGTQSRFGDAIAALDEALQLAPDDPRIFRTRSSFHAILDEMSAALMDAEAAVHLAPDNLEYADHLEDIRDVVGLPATRTATTPQAEPHWLASRFVPPPRIAPKTRGIGAALAESGRVISAIVLRETRTRFGHTRLGYFWAVFEPISHLMTLGLVFRIFNHAPPPVGDNLFLFYLTGLMPFLIFWHISQDLIHVLAANASLLQMPIVRPLDVALARSVLYFATQITVCIIVFSAAALLGVQGMPSDLLGVMMALAALWVMATGIGLINIVISSFVGWWETVFAGVNRLLYFASGIYYSPIFLPETVRDWLTWNPVLQGVEWFRAGFYSQYNPPWLERPYFLTWSALSLLIGLSLFRVFRKHLSMHR